MQCRFRDFRRKEVINIHDGARLGFVADLDVRIPEVSSRTLYIDKVDVCTKTGANRAIASFDGAIAKVSEVRSSIGAYQNRLDYAVSSLDGTELNMTQALSRIEDVDMAEEI